MHPILINTFEILIQATIHTDFLMIKCLNNKCFNG